MLIHSWFTWDSSWLCSFLGENRNGSKLKKNGDFPCPLDSWKSWKIKARLQQTGGYHMITDLNALRILQKFSNCKFYGDLLKTKNIFYKPLLYEETKKLRGSDSKSLTNAQWMTSLWCLMCICKADCLMKQESSHCIGDRVQNPYSRKFQKDPGTLSAFWWQESQLKSSKKCFCAQKQ